MTMPERKHKKRQHHHDVRRNVTNDPSEFESNETRGKRAYNMVLDPVVIETTGVTQSANNYRDEWTCRSPKEKKKPVRFEPVVKDACPEPECTNLYDVAFAYIDYYKQQIKNGKISNDTVFKYDKDSGKADVKLETILTELESILKNPAKNCFNYQGYTCGPSAAIFVSLQNNPVAFVSLVIDLFVHGEASYRDSKRARNRIAIPKWVIDDALRGRIDGMISGEKITVRIVDYVLGYALRGTQNKIFKNSKEPSADDYKVDNFYQSTFPWEEKSLLRRMGVRTEEYDYWGGYQGRDGEKVLKLLEKAINECRYPIIFDNHIITSRRHVKFYEDHDRTFVNVIAGNLGIHYVPLIYLKVEGDNVRYKYWDYGGLNAEETISKREFLKGIKGYWIPKNRYVPYKCAPEAEQTIKFNVHDYDRPEDMPEDPLR